MKAATFKQVFEQRFDRKVEGMNLPILSKIRINTLILETLMEVAEFHQMEIDTISLEHHKRGGYSLTVNEDMTIILQIEKRKEAVNV